MEISKMFARQMVEELSGIIHQHINFMDKQGIIIASTDASRIDSCHMGAKQIIDQSLPCLIIDSDDEYSGSKKGVNLPIVVAEEVVGVIGITGDRNKVAKYGEIIKKFTEMYIRDGMLRKEQEMDEKIQCRFIEQWLTESDFSKDNNFINIGLSVNVDVMMKRRTVLIKFLINDDQDLKEEQNRIDAATKAMKRVLCVDKQHFSMPIGPKLVFLIQDKSDEELLVICRSLVHYMKEKFSLCINIGIDEKGRIGKELHVSYLQAKKSLSACQPVAGHMIKLYRDLNLELFLHDIPNPIKQEFVSRVFSGCSEMELKEYYTLLRLLYQNNGSIEKTAKELYIHKNTLQYKLNKLHEASGYNPRHTADLPLFYLALRFFDLLIDA